MKINHKLRIIVQSRSYLHVMSKIIEYVMHSQFMDYFTLNGLFSTQQYGIRTNRSTELEVIDRNI